MSLPGNKLTSPASLAVDAVLCVLFFAFMFRVLGPRAVEQPAHDRALERRRIVLPHGRLLALHPDVSGGAPRPVGGTEIIPIAPPPASLLDSASGPG